MVVYETIEDVKNINASIVTIGSFDGVHRGHETVIDKVLTLAYEKAVPSVIISFDPHPQAILNPSFRANQQLITTEKKIEIFQNKGIDYLWLIPFNRTFSRISADIFLREYLIEYFKPLDIIIGYDHHFGANQEGNSQFLLSFQEVFRYNLFVVEPISLNNSKISSTSIRDLLKYGKVEEANAMLGREYEMQGIVIKGAQLGQKIGFPTANIKINTNTSPILKKGVYCVDVEIDGEKHQGMCNIGMRPTFHDNGDLTIEAHIFGERNFELYNKPISLYFKQFIREEKKYTNADELILQLNLDRQICLSI